MGERFAQIKHLDRLYEQNLQPYEMPRIEATHGGEDASPEWVTSKSLVKVCQVPWDSGYENVIDWGENDRNKFFEELDGRVYDFPTSWNFKKLEEFKASVNGYVGECDVPLTFEEALYYNYVWIRQYRQHVSKGEVIEDFYFFIHSLDKIAPNTTRLNIHNDIWTQYYTHFSFKFGDLERGHLPHYLQTTDSFFNNPIEAATDLTQPEPDLGSLKSATRFENFTQLDSELVAVVVSDIMLEKGFYSVARDGWWENFDSQPATVGEPAAYPRRRETFSPQNNGSTVGRRQAGNSFPANYLDETATPETLYNQAWLNSAAQQLQFYKIVPEDLPKLAKTIHSSFPHFADKIRAIYLMPEKFVAGGSPVELIGDVEAEKIQPQCKLEAVKDVKLSPEQFGYVSEFAKLYTGQFAEIEFSTLAGEKVTVALENFSDHVQILGRSHTTFPFLKLEALITGIGGNQENSYAFKAFTPSEATSWADSWEEFRMQLPFPVFSLYSSGDTTNAVNYLANVQARENMARANTYALEEARNQLENATNSANKEEAQLIYNSEVAKITGDRSNAAAKTVSDNNANTAKTTADRTTTTEYRNSTNQNLTQNRNETRDINTENDIAGENREFTFEQTTRDITNSRAMALTLDRYYRVKPLSQQLDWIAARRGTKHALNTAQVAAGGGFSVAARAVNYLTMTGTSTNTQDKQNSTSEAAAPLQKQANEGSASFTEGGHTMSGPTAADPITQTGQLAAQIALVNANLAIMLDWDAEEKRWAREFNREQIDTYAEWLYTFNTDQNEYNREHLQRVNALNIAKRTANEAARYETQAGVNTASRDTGLANNQTTLINSLANNQTSYQATANNVQLSRNAGETNAHHSAAVSLANAANNYRLALDKARSDATALERQQKAQILSNRLQKLQETTSFSGDYQNATENGYTGVSVKIRTLPDAQIRQAEQAFNRWGYRMKPGTVITAPKRLSLFTAFTFWQFRNVEGFVDGNISSVNAIKEILRKGVTVWTRPATIYSFENNERIPDAV